jgi:hypothetical protein
MEKKDEKPWDECDGSANQTVGVTSPPSFAKHGATSAQIMSWIRAN